MQEYTTLPTHRLMGLAADTPKSAGMIYYGWHDNANVRMLRDIGCPPLFTANVNPSPAQGGHWGIPPGTKVIGTPLLGFYRSDERRVLVQHTEWLLGSGM